METPDFASLEQRSQKALIDFLSTDLDLCFTMLESARLSSRREHRERTLATVRAGLVTLRYLMDRVQNASTSSKLHARADELESAISSA